MKLSRAALALTFLLSGASALTYEILWVRLIALFFGNTTLAISAVLAAFMTGLAVGSWLGGKLADRGPVGRLVLYYGLIEAAIAGFGALSLPLVWTMRQSFAPLHLIQASVEIQSLAYFSSALLVMIAPTTLMGTTLPILTRWSAYAGGEPRQLDRPLSLLYCLNTLGAVFGSILAGFYLIPKLGLSRTLFTTVCANLVCCSAAFAVWGLARRGTSSLGGRPESQPATDFQGHTFDLRLAVFLAGAAAMLCEIAWTRVFASEIGSSTYAFTIVLAGVLLGLAAGSEIFHSFRAVANPSRYGLSFLFAAIGISILASLPLFNWIPFQVMRIVTGPGGFGTEQISEFVLFLLVTAVPALLMGAALPWAVAAAKPGESNLGRATGSFYAANTAGAIVGSIFAGLALMPWLGAEKTLIFAAWLYAAAAAGIFLTLPAGARSAEAIAVLAATLIAVAVRPSWDARAIASGMFLYGAKYKDSPDFASFRKELSDEGLRVVWHKDGLVANVDVMEDDTGERFLRINGKTDASVSGDYASQALVGYLPLLLHPGIPRRALVVGLGSGTTAAGLALERGLRDIRIVEIEPAVAEAAPFFRKANRNVLDDPRVHLIFGDARQYIESGDSGFDLIVSEPSNPWIAGVANLYTVEAFEAAKRALADDGVFCQWFHSYRMSPEDFKMIVRTFVSVFPHAELMNNGGVDFYLLGSKRPWKIDVSELRGRLRENAALRRDLQGIQMGLDDPLAMFAFAHVLGGRDLRSLAGQGPLNTDDLPILEFSAPRFMESESSNLIAAELAAAKRSILPENLEGLSHANREHAVVLNIEAERLMTSGEIQKAADILGRATEIDPKNAHTETNLGILEEMRKHPRDAQRHYRRAIELEPDFAPARLSLGVLLVSQKRSAEGIRELERGLALMPADPMGSQYLALALLEQGRAKEALAVIRPAMERPVPDLRIRQNLETAAGLAEQAVNKAIRSSSR